jgi:RimJ/RimL family protein N-acetyltransferase
MGLITARPAELKQGGTILIRSARPDDAPALIAHAKDVLQEGIFGVTRVEEFNMTEAKEREWVLEHNEAAGDLVLVADSEGVIAGLLFFESGPRQRQLHRGALHMSVDRRWRGRGVGEAMLKVLLEWAKENPVIEKVGLSVLSSNTRAHGLYKKLGFIEEGRRPREVKLGKDEYVDEILMFRFVK